MTKAEEMRQLTRSCCDDLITEVMQIIEYNAKSGKFSCYIYLLNKANADKVASYLRDNGFYVAVEKLDNDYQHGYSVKAEW